MPFVGAAVAAAGTIAGAAISADASKSAASTQRDAAQLSANEQAGIFNQTRNDLSPFYAGGVNSYEALLNYMGVGGQPGAAGPQGTVDMSAPGVRPFSLADFQSSPGYGFQLSQGINAIDNSSAAKGFTGNTLKDLMTFGQGLANQDYWNAYNAYTQNQTNTFNRLFNLGQSGQSAANQTGAIGSSTGANIGNSLIGAGNASAAGTIGSANAIGGAFNSTGNNIAQNFLLTQLLQGGGGATASGGGLTQIGNAGAS